MVGLAGWEWEWDWEIDKTTTVCETSPRGGFAFVSPVSTQRITTEDEIEEEEEE